jgi:hypothetical protein
MDENERLDPAAELPAADGGDDGGNDDAAEARVERILQHVADSLQEPDALQAAVGAAGGDLLLMQYRLRQALDETLQATPASLTAIAQALPALNTFLKLSQQVGQFVQLSLKIKAAKGGSQLGKSSSSSD